MKLIVGLGNHGEEYIGTRHNLGWMSVAELAHMHGASFQRDAHLRARIAKARIGEETVLFALPLTYMNLSGQAVAALITFYHLQLSDVLVVQDELDIPLGALRFSLGGSAAGHNGIRSVTQSLGGEAIARLRLGIGRPSTPQPIEDFVLERFSAEEEPVAAQIIKESGSAIETWISAGLDTAMQGWNGKKA